MATPFQLLTQRAQELNEKNLQYQQAVANGHWPEAGRLIRELAELSGKNIASLDEIQESALPKSLRSDTL